MKKYYRNWISRTKRRYGSKSAKRSYKHIPIGKGQSRHHRVCKSHGGGGDPENIAVVSSARHKGWHAVFRNMTAPQIAVDINKNWIGGKYRFICIDTTTGEVVTA